MQSWVLKKCAKNYGDRMIYLFAMPTAGNFTGGADKGVI